MSTYPPRPAPVFYAKTWCHYAAPIAFTVLALFCASLGPLFLFGVLQRADGKPGTEAGVMMSCAAVVMGPIAWLGWCNVYARRMPMLQICKDGIVVNTLGALRLDGVELPPVLIRVAQLLMSRQGLNPQLGWIPWEMFRDVAVTGLPLQRYLVMDATVVHAQNTDNGLVAKASEGIVFRDAEFQVPLESIAFAILMYYGDSTARSELPSGSN